jgi:putative transposase
MPTNNGRLRNLSHRAYIRQYRMAWVVKYGGKALADACVKRETRRIIKSVSNWKGFVPIQWRVGDEHTRPYIIVPPEYSIAYPIRILKSKSSGWIKKKTGKFTMGSFWCRGYFVSAVGINEIRIRNCIKNQGIRGVDLTRQTLWKKQA